MNEYILVVGRADYSDEFDCEAILITTMAEFEEIKANAKAAFCGVKNIEIPIGTNESLFFSSYDEWLSKLKVSIISEITYNELTRIFVSQEFGTGSEMFYPSDYLPF